jgi:hypothetical protein
MRYWIIVFACVFAASCTQDHKKTKESGPSPTLDIQSINDSCLNFQSIVQQMSQDGFSFPGLVYTRDFEVLSAVGNTEFLHSLYARSWRYEEKDIESLNDFGSLAQQGCESITLPDFNFASVPYKISDFSKTHLELTLDREKLNESLKDLPEEQRGAIMDFPAVGKWIVRVISPTQVEVTSFYQAVPTICVDGATPDIREVAVYHWDARGSVRPTAEVNARYWQRLTDAAAPMEMTTDSERVAVDRQSSEALSNALESRIYVPCH